MNAKEIEKKVIEVMAEMFEVQPEELSSDTKPQEDLGADSIDIVDLIIAFETEYDTTFPDDDIFNANLDTIGDITKFIEEHLNK
jgi:acyl carrier protein